MAKKKFYVVWVGKQTGVFTDWAVVQPLVAGHPGAKHKSFLSMEEAKKALDSGAPAAESCPRRRRLPQGSSGPRKKHKDLFSIRLMTFTFSRMARVIQTRVRQVAAWRFTSKAYSQSFGTDAMSR